MHGGCCASVHGVHVGRRAWRVWKLLCMACMEAVAHAERPMQEDACIQGYLGAGVFGSF